MAADTTTFIERLREIVGARHVLTKESETRRYRTGYRFGGGPVLAVARPGTLVEQWRVLQACVQAGLVVITQAANTGLTGGSTPDGAGYDRGVVIINVMRIKGIHLIDGGKQVVCKPGSTLAELETLLKPIGREPHSVIGSSCVGASVLGGIANNSGGALVNRGPAYTELALYARVSDAGALELVNHLGIRLGDDPETMLTRLDEGDFQKDVEHDPSRAASYRDYTTKVRDITADTPARFNANPEGLFEASGSAGKLMLFAVRLDTFPQERDTSVFYVGTNDPAELTQLRRKILSGFETLPIAGEYIHRRAYDLAEEYGKDTFLAIHILGTARLPQFFALKAWLDGALGRVGFPALTDHVLQVAANLFPPHLPRRMKAFRDRFEHHLVLKTSQSGVAEARACLQGLFPSASGDMFECTPDEGAKAFLHRFSVAGAAVRYRAIHAGRIEDIVAIDVALRRNDEDWAPELPAHILGRIEHALNYGHFLCHVFHQDYIVVKGADTHALEQELLALLHARGAQFPAEHNFGHLYVADAHVLAHYEALDPCNCLNPGIGKASKAARWSRTR